MASEQQALPILTLAHSTEEPDEAWGDWWTRADRAALCATCHEQGTRGRYCTYEDGGPVEVPMCPACWFEVVHAPPLHTSRGGAA